MNMNNEYNLLSKIYVDMVNHVPEIVESEQWPHCRVIEIEPEKFDMWTRQMKVILNNTWTALLDKEALNQTKEILTKLKDCIQRRLEHTEKREQEYKRYYGELNTEKDTCHGGYARGMWAGRGDAYDNVLGYIDELLAEAEEPVKTERR